VTTVLLALLCLAPVPGDIGSCGQTVQALDPGIFFASKKAIDCRRCRECGLSTGQCRSACNGNAPIPEEFPTDCVPLVHDGEVCLRALLHASCDDYSAYMDDTAPEVPTECNFCPPREE
jgi:hypothetical protein